MFNTARIPFSDAEAAPHEAIFRLHPEQAVVIYRTTCARVIEWFAAQRHAAVDNAEANAIAAGRRSLCSDILRVACNPFDYNRTIAETHDMLVAFRFAIAFVNKDYHPNALMDPTRRLAQVYDGNSHLTDLFHVITLLRKRDPIVNSFVLEYLRSFPDLSDDSLAIEAIVHALCRDNNIQLYVMGKPVLRFLAQDADIRLDAYYDIIADAILSGSILMRDRPYRVLQDYYERGIAAGISMGSRTIERIKYSYLDLASEPAAVRAIVSFVIFYKAYTLAVKGGGNIGEYADPEDLIDEFSDEVLVHLYDTDVYSEDLSHLSEVIMDEVYDNIDVRRGLLRRAFISCIRGLMSNTALHLGTKEEYERQLAAVREIAASHLNGYSTAKWYLNKAMGCIHYSILPIKLCIDLEPESADGLYVYRALGAHNISNMKDCARKDREIKRGLAVKLRRIINQRVGDQAKGKSKDKAIVNDNLASLAGYIAEF